MQIILRIVGIVLLAIAADTAWSQGDVRIPDNVRASWTHLIGDWDIEGSIDSTPVEGTARFRWADGEYCYLAEQVWEIGSGGSVVKLTLVGGWDASKNATVESGFDSLGTSGTSQFAPPEEESDVSKGSFDVTRGPATHFTGTVELQRHGPNEFQLITMVDGKLVHSLQYTRAKPDSGDASNVAPGE